MSNETPPDTTPQKTAFDRLTRILATPLPRRQAIKLVAGLVASSTFGSWGHQAQAGTNIKQNKRPLPLDTPVHNFVATNETVLQLIRRLRGQFQVPLSLIETTFKHHVSIKIVDGTLKDVLMQLVKQAPGYTWEKYKDHIVVYPNEAKYKVLITPHLAKGARFEVTDEYIAYIKTQSSGFEDLAGVAIVATFNWPYLSDQVSLSSSGTILHLFVDLLGDDQSVMFSILGDEDGIFTMGFNRVADFPAEAPSAKTSENKQKKPHGSCRAASFSFSLPTNRRPNPVRRPARRRSQARGRLREQSSGPVFREQAGDLSEVFDIACQQSRLG